MQLRTDDSSAKWVRRPIMADGGAPLADCYAFLFRIAKELVTGSAGGGNAGLARQREPVRDHRPRDDRRGST